MNYVNQTNQFFDKVYTKIGLFATSPYTGWSKKHLLEKSKWENISWENISNDLLLKAYLTPVLLPLTIVTTAVSLVLTAVAAFIHLLALLGSAYIDSSAPLFENSTFINPM